MLREIANANLTADNIPMPNAEWYSIAEFALTFDAYSHWGSFDKCADIANRSAQTYAQRRVLSVSLAELRTCLFFEQRRYHHFGHGPDETEMRYIHALVEGIRERVVTGETD